MPKMSLADQKLKMASWIEKGLKTKGLEEGRYGFINKTGECNVIGFALIGKFGSLKKAIRYNDGISRRPMREALGIETRLFDRICKLHFMHYTSASEIAKRLRAEVDKSTRKLIEASYNPPPVLTWFYRGNKP